MRPDAKKKIATVTPKAGPNPVVIGAIVAVLVVVAVVVAIVIGNGTSGSSTAAGSGVPVGVVGGTGGGIFANAAQAKPNAPTLDLYEDFQCSNCGHLEQAMGAQIFSMAKAGQFRLVVHMLSFLDTNLGNDSSLRAANAAACAADTGKFLEYHRAVFAKQPAEGVGYTNAQLTGFAKTAGISGSALTTWQKCTTSGQHDQYVNDVQTAAEKAGVNSTPTLKLNGKDITQTLSSAAAFAVEVKAATS